MKAKTHSGSKKRIKVTGTGKFRTGKIGKRHLLQNKSAKSKGKGKYGYATHIANERKMKIAMQVQGLRTPNNKKNILNKDADGKIIKTPRVASKIKVLVPKVVKTPAPKAAPKKAPAKKTAAKKK
jgi:ribosomal protein L35